MMNIFAGLLITLILVLGGFSIMNSFFRWDIDESLVKYSKR